MPASADTRALAFAESEYAPMVQGEKVGACAAIASRTACGTPASRSPAAEPANVFAAIGAGAALVARPRPVSSRHALTAMIANAPQAVMAATRERRRNHGQP